MPNSACPHLQQADILVQDVLRAAVADHAPECDVGANDLHQLVRQVILTPEQSTAAAAP
jgi:hypothetical protein